MEKIIGLDVKKLLAIPGKHWGFEKYEKIMKSFSVIDVRSDRDFQKNFNGFYRVRRNVEWQKNYYSIMEQGKTKKQSFEEVLSEMYARTGRVEASFASKLLHTIDHNMPIWDQFVLQNLNKKLPICRGEEKIEKCIKIYGEIVTWYKEALADIGVRQKLFEFDEILPQYKWFSSTKKLDFLLWQMR